MKQSASPFYLLNDETYGSDESRFVEVIGLEVLYNDDREQTNPGFDGISLSDDSSEEDAFENDSIVLAQKRGLRKAKRRTRRARRRMSNDSYSNDSVEISKVKKVDRASRHASSDSSQSEIGGYWIPLKGTEKARHSPKVTSTAVSAPDLDGLELLRFSNAAA